MQISPVLVPSCFLPEFHKVRHHVVPLLQQRGRQCLANEDIDEARRNQGNQGRWQDQGGRKGASPNIRRRRLLSTLLQSSHPNWDWSFQDDWASSHTKQVSHTWKYFVARAYHRTQGHYRQVGGSSTLDVRHPVINNSIITTSEERDINTWVWALPLATAKLGGGARYRITITLLSLLFFLVRSFWLYLDLVE